MIQNGINFNPEWSIKVNVEHILGDAENLERIPAKIRKAKNLPLLLETAVEFARRQAIIKPGMVVPQGYQGKLQYLLPINLTNMKKPDLAMTLTVMDGYYLGNTCLTPGNGISKCEGDSSSCCSVADRTGKINISI